MRYGHYGSWFVLFGAVLTALGGVSGCIVPRPINATGPTADAIGNAAVIDDNARRLSLLRGIATQTDLSPPNQQYLVDAVIMGGVGGRQSEPLNTLIDNPCCTDDTRRYVSQRLRFVTYSSERKLVADALARHPLPAKSP